MKTRFLLSKNKPARIPIAVIFVLFSYFFSQVLAGIIIYAVLAVQGYNESEISNILSDSTLSQFTFLGFAMAGELVLFYGLVKYLNLYIDYLKPKNFKLENIWIIAVAIGAYMALSTLAMDLFKGLIDEDQKQIIGFENVNGGLELVMVFVALVILAPLAEEIIFRGYLFGEFKHKVNFIISALLVSVIFGLFHLQLGSGKPPLWAGFIDTFALSLVLCYIREKTNTIWYGVGVHSLKNFLAFLLLFVLHLNI
ncbi:MAG: CPBP family intramembrane glutamic endopeptidase [Patescibacteria group bacterium]